MLEYVNYYKLKDKLILAIMTIVVFGFLYTTVDKNEISFDNTDLINCMLYSLSTQTFKYDFIMTSGRCLMLTTIQIIISYVILIIN